jgi:hypothetical protein
LAPSIKTRGFHQDTHQQPDAFAPDHQSTIIIHRSLRALRYLLFQFFFAQEEAEEAEKNHVAFGKREEFTKSPTSNVTPSYPIIHQQSSITDFSAPSATSCCTFSLNRRTQRKQREETWRLPQNLAPSRLCVRSNKNQRRHVSTARIPRATPGKLHPKSARLDGLPVAVVPFRQSRGRAFHGEFGQQPLLLGNVSADN